MKESSRPLRIAVLGAGPIGIEAALYGAALGHEVLCIEQGAVGHSVSLWSQATMFSPWRMNVTPLGLHVLAELGKKLPHLEHCPTGAEFLAEYLLPLSESPHLKDRLRLGSRVVSVGRPGLLKGDLIAKAARADAGFRLLIEDSAGEHLEFADAILDCSGTYLFPNPIGDGGVLSPGERWLTARLFRHLPDVLGRDRKRFAQRRTLLIGGGLSAATAAVAFSQLCAEEKGTEVLWAMRKPTLPAYLPISNDSLRERAALHEAANRVAQQGEKNDATGVRFLLGTVVDALAAQGHQLRVRLRKLDAQSDNLHEELFDEVVGLTGYGPDRSLYEQLQVHECYASFGPMQLAATLAFGGGDCLAQPKPGIETLKNPEPRFFILGAKSYAKNSAFLLEIGHAQVRGAYAILQNDEGLDLYKKG